MKFIITLFVVLLAGCMHNDYNEILQKPAETWTHLDCMTIVANESVHNFFDTDSRVRAYITPFTPSVITAICRMDQQKLKASDEDFNEQLGALLLEDLGIYFNGNTKSLYDKEGKNYQDLSQADTLMLFLTLENKTWPCVTPMKRSGSRMVPVVPFPQSDYPCYTPDISDLPERIYLLNNKGELLSPRGVWGRRQNVFMRKERLLIVFSLKTNDGDNYLAQSKSVALVIKDMDERELKLEIPALGKESTPNEKK